MSDHGEHGEEARRRRRAFTPEFKAEIVVLLINACLSDSSSQYRANRCL
jgi:transposase-like protein